MIFNAVIRHSRDTLRRFTSVQYGTFEFTRKAVLFLISVALILFGVYRLSCGESIFSLILLFLGCILLTNLNSRAEAIADRVAEAMNNVFPTLSYSFYEDCFSDGEDRPSVAYSSLYRIMEDGEYLYIFTSKASGYMIPCAAVRRTGSDECAVSALKSLISEKSGLVWTRPLSLSGFSLRDLRTLLGK